MPYELLLISYQYIPPFSIEVIKRQTQLSVTVLGVSFSGPFGVTLKVFSPR